MKDALRARVEAFYREFPFLARYVKLSELLERTCPERPTVRRVDLDLLDQIPFSAQWTGDFFPGDRRFILIDAGGREIAEVRQSDKVKPKFSFLHPQTWLRRRVQGETVYEAIQKLWTPNQVCYVLEIEHKWGYTVIVHKIPAGRIFSEWIRQIQDVASDEIRAEVAIVDAH